MMKARPPLSAIFFLVCAALVGSTCLPAVAQDWAKAALENSPRHLEWINVKNGDRTVKAFIAYPEVKNKATAVVVIHEIFGLSDWVRSVADQLAARGYIAIAPDLLSGTAPGGGGTEAYSGEDAIRKAVSALPVEQVMSDLDAVSSHVSKLPASNSKVASVGFCWGGTQAFRFANHNKNQCASFVFYGTGPDEASEIANISAPVFGFYGENDARVNATLDETTRLMKSAKKKFETVIYKDAGHGFMRAGEAPHASDANKAARAAAWKRWEDVLRSL